MHPAHLTWIVQQHLFNVCMQATSTTRLYSSEEGDCCRTALWLAWYGGNQRRVGTACTGLKTSYSNHASFRCVANLGMCNCTTGATLIFNGFVT